MLNQVENELWSLRDELSLSINQAKEILMGKVLDRELVHGLSAELDKSHQFIADMSVNQSWCLQNAEDNDKSIINFENNLENFASKVAQLSMDHPLAVDWREMVEEFDRIKIEKRSELERWTAFSGRRNQLENEVDMLVDGALRRLDKSQENGITANSEDITPVENKLVELQHKSSILEKLMDELNPGGYDPKYYEVKRKIEAGAGSISALKEKAEVYKNNENLEKEVDKILKKAKNGSYLDQTEVELASGKLDEITGKAREFYAKQFMIMPKDLASKLAEAGQILKETSREAGVKENAFIRNLDRIEEKLAEIEVCENGFEALMIAHGILERVAELERLGVNGSNDDNDLRGLKKHLFSKINELETELAENPQVCRAVVDDFLENIAGIKSVISHAEKLDLSELNPLDSVNMAGLLTEHVEMVKHVRAQLPVIKSLEDILGGGLDSPSVTESELEAYEFRLIGLRNQIKLPPTLVVTSPDGRKQILPGLLKIEDCKNEINDNISNWQNADTFEDVEKLHQDSTEQLNNVKTVLSNLDSSAEYKPNKFQRKMSDSLLKEVTKQLDDLALVSQPVLLERFKQPSLWKRLLSNIEELRRRIKMFEETLDRLPEADFYDPAEAPTLKIMELRKRWISKGLEDESNESIQSILEDVESMLDEANSIEPSLSKVTPILRFPLTDKLNRLLALIRAFKIRVLKSTDNLNQGPTLGYQQLLADFEIATSRILNERYVLPIQVEHCGDFDTIVTEFKIDYDNFNEIYGRLLKNDFDETSSGTTVDHIEISNELMEKFSALVEAQEDMAQLRKRLDGGGRRKRSSLMAGSVGEVTPKANSFLRGG